MMQKILLAGATGYLGGHIARELKRRQYHVRAIARNPEKLVNTNALFDEIRRAELTRAGTLSGCCTDMEVVISTVGITRQRDGLTYMDVDYQANLNLLEEALKSGVRKFIYAFIFNADKLSGLKIVEAKQRFALELERSGMDYCLVNPTGFFSDMGEFYRMAEKNRVFLFGKGSFRMNPVAGEDVAKVCADAVNRPEKAVNVGGPQVLTHQEIALTAFRVLNKPVRITHIPVSVKSFILFLLRLFTPVRLYGPVEFFMTVLTTDMIAPRCEGRVLESYFRELQAAGPGTARQEQESPG